ncbi:MAG: hypothetical protein V4502_10230, partial [Pseudomonadota bacterium]
MRIPFISLAGSAIALGGCAYGGLGLGVGYGNGYSPYGYYGSGYGSPYYGAGYGYGYGSPYHGGFGYGSPYGWYDNYYYPGTGYYVYDTYRQPHLMTTAQRSYWLSRRQSPASTVTTRTVQPNWSGLNRAPRASYISERTSGAQSIERS